MGGGEVQLLSCRRELSRQGIKATLFDPWNPCLDVCDIVHFFSVMPGSLAFCEYVRKRNIPLFISPNMWMDDNTSKNIPLESIREQLEQAERIVCNSALEAQNFSRILGLAKEKFLVIHCGIDDIFLDRANTAIFRKRTRGINNFVLNVGTIEKRKNQLTLIRAMKAFPTYSVVLIGHVRDQIYADQCLKEGGSQLIYLGPLLHEDPLLRSAMAACDLFVGPGLTETPGGANLEAAAQGAPIVMTEAGSTREYFKDMVSYFDPKDETSLTNAIATTLGKGLDETLRQHTCAHYRWQKVLAPLVEAYRVSMGSRAS
ncbi:MAG: glycosyltransferase family 4 protein [Azoarcus sp.]|nr:glycosyltransferase family 4 protein [Azoarcus sp.]